MIQPVENVIALPSDVNVHTISWVPTVPAAGRQNWLLVHGLASNARMWDGVGRALAEAGHHAVAVNQRGHGPHSSKPDDGYEMAMVADDLAFLVTELGWSSISLVGQSWGGNVVIETARRHPNMVDLVVGVDGGSINLRTQFPIWDEALAALTPPQLAGRKLSEMVAWAEQSARDWPREGLQGTLANFEVLPDATVAPWLTYQRHLQVLRGLWEHDPVAALAEVKSPVLFIAADSSVDGNNDWTRQKEAGISEALAVLEQGKAVWIQPAHHDVHAQKPQEVADFLLAATDPNFF